MRYLTASCLLAFLIVGLLAFGPFASTHQSGRQILAAVVVTSLAVMGWKGFTHPR